MFAVIKTGGKQYRVAADDLLKIERLAGNAGDMVEFTSVLAVGEGERSTIGAPLVDGALVTAEIVEQGRAGKVLSFKKRRRQNSRRIRGHRQLLTTVRISEILTEGAKPSKKAAAKKQAPAKEPAAEPKKAETKAEAPKKAETRAAAPKEAAGKKAGTKAEAPAAAAPLFKAPAGKGDDLTAIKGIGPVAAGQLNEQGITTFAQIAKLTDKEVEKIDEAMPFSADQIRDWRDQAGELAK